MTVRGDEGIHRRRPGAVAYGAEIGVVMLDFDSPFVPGDMGNAATYSRPAAFRAVPGLSVSAILEDDAGAFEAAVVDAALELAAGGVRAITSNCGFMIRYQDAVAAAVAPVPVGLSSLVQLPMLAALLPAGGRIGIVTADARVLDAAFVERFLPGLGARVAVHGLESAPSFRQTMFELGDELDADGIRREVVDAVAMLTRREPDVSALLFECAALPAYSSAVQSEFPRLPVFDFGTLAELLLTATARTPYIGHV
ncbi:aspartate/glutamate racemase family protein [Microbacterium ulmi]|uniref:Aspartate/glutamate racemase family protein n=1 Tax=Microbacterium ulmi TaxID=179095 RepID=A0A7Y2LY93_9MICO|nr:aspartate/glutamate racemase family protein [Microbacterium ulmi]NII68431.1 hypothetical protein [Microbacterium ulmi]NNH03046.1 aspartate/glutamate racemase family protein [Microbacterium ulmi]